MAGHLYIRNITSAQLTDLHNTGGVMVDTIFHYDVTYANGSGALVTQEGANAQNRHGLPAHCYVTYQRNNTSQAALQGINATLSLLSKPAGIIAANQRLALWPGAGVNAAANMLWAALQFGAVTVEFYQLDGVEVRVAVPYNAHAAVPGYMRFLTEALVEVYE